jgi:hypothetical protein
VVSLQSAKDYLKRMADWVYRQTCVEAGSNTSTVTLWIVGGDEKGSLKTETVKYGRGFQGTWTQERLHWRGPVAYTKDRPVVSSEKAPHKNKTVTSSSNKYLVMSPRWGYTPRLTCWPTVSRNVTLTLSLQTVKGQIARWGTVKKTPDRRGSEQSKVKL